MRWYGAPNSVPAAMWMELLCVLRDECQHFLWLNERLGELGGYAYGDVPAHDGLWETALDTKTSLLARVAMLPLVQEARALDAQPRLVHKLLSQGDRRSAGLVNQICDEEVPHVHTGMRWFRYLVGYFMSQVWRLASVLTCCHCHHRLRCRVTSATSLANRLAQTIVPKLATQLWPRFMQ